jgi:hypothetical protein
MNKDEVKGSQCRKEELRRKRKGKEDRGGETRKAVEARGEQNRGIRGDDAQRIRKAQNSTNKEQTAEARRGESRLEQWFV